MSHSKLNTNNLQEIRNVSGHCNTENENITDLYIRCNNTFRLIEISGGKLSQAFHHTKLLHLSQ